MPKEALQEMDDAAKAAEKELLEHFDQWSARVLAEWWNKWYVKAGHKRLGRILLNLTK